MLYSKILIINTFGIGDVLFTTPLIRNIKTNAANTYIGYLANGRTAPVLAANPLINKVFIYERDEYVEVYQRSKLEFFRRMTSQVEEIRREKFDCVLDLSLNSSAGFLMWWAGIPQRVGFDYKKRGFFLTRKVRLSGFVGRPVAEHYLDLLARIGYSISSREMEFPVTPEDQRWAQDFLARQGLTAGQKLVAMVPGGGASWGKDAGYKRWPGERFAQLADKIIAKSSAVIILLGDQRERELCAWIASGIKGSLINACGETTLGQMAALFKLCALAVVNDGGPLHVAAACGVKTVSIFGPVDEKVYGPYPGTGHRVVKADIACRPCYRQFRRASCEHVSCLNNIFVDDVFREVAGALGIQETGNRQLIS